MLYAAMMSRQQITFSLPQLRIGTGRFSPFYGKWSHFFFFFAINRYIWKTPVRVTLKSRKWHFQELKLKNFPREHIRSPLEPRAFGARISFFFPIFFSGSAPVWSSTKEQFEN